MANHPAFTDTEMLKTVLEAEDQLDSLLKERDALQARVKELEDEIQRRNFIRAMTGPDLHDKAETWHAQATEFANRADEAESRALRAEQERDEAYERAASLADEHSFAMDIEWWLNATKKEVSAVACRSVAAAIRRLAGPEKIAAANDGEERR